MNTLNQLLADTKQQTRRNALSYAQDNNYNVTELYNEAKKARFELMSAIHANGKEGNYTLATKYTVIVETLETYTR